MTAESDGKGRRAGQPDLLASLPAEKPPSSRPEPGIDPAIVEELLAGVRELREQLAGVSEAVSAERPGALTRETLDAWGDSLVARVAEAARTAAKPAAAPKDDAAVSHIARIEEAAAKSASAAERIDGRLDSTADRVATEVGEAVTRIEQGLAAMRDHVARQTRQSDPVLYDIHARTAVPRFTIGTILKWVVIFVLGMVLESYFHILYRWFAG